MTPPDLPQSRVDPSLAYVRAPLPEGVTLRLDANEGAAPPLDVVLTAIRDAGPDLLRRYPDARPFEAMLAGQAGVEPSQVFVAAGADEVLDRCCRAFLPPGATMLMAEPGFEVFNQYAALCGATVATVPWSPGPFPIDEMLGRVDDRVAAIAFVTPNNPTGEVASLDDLRRLALAAPRALIILDHAYVEFADADLTVAALQLPNVMVARTFSKAWGLAGCRVGYALGPAWIIRSLRAAGGPFPVSSASLAIARALIERGTAARDAYVARVRAERGELFAFLERLDGRPRRSEANFVFAELGDRSSAVHAALVSQGVLVRFIAEKSGTPRGLRISLPGDADSFATLLGALEFALTQGGPR